MKISILQLDLVWENPQENLRKADAAIASAPGADLYVLPEMFPTGFCTVPDGVAEPEGGLVLQWMKDKAAGTDAALAGSVAVRDEGRYYNRFYFVTPDGSVTWYDKKHLFTYGGEHKYFTAGDKRVVLEFRGVRIMLLVCYDLRFPIWSRNHGDYDMILYVASWPVTRMNAWKSLLVARAIENQCYVAGVNRVGTDPSNEYGGGSMVIDPYGKMIASCEDGVECSASAEIDIPMLEAFREKFPVLNDSDII
ncbi:MAG: amidohydrolase [Bacteroidales bacterium]|nr:amidohydrolase [Bacteroidales bacterium]